ncbi:hypothetical protein C8R44DRAFT_885789 [Mycena epipterygia]|nr:hypothetical protein C8R44DRAFT_885789 [Mycena epipterygia]
MDILDQSSTIFVVARLLQDAASWNRILDIPIRIENYLQDRVLRCQSSPLELPALQPSMAHGARGPGLITPPFEPGPLAQTQAGVPAAATVRALLLSAPGEPRYPPKESARPLPSVGASINHETLTDYYLPLRGRRDPAAATRALSSFTRRRWLCSESAHLINGCEARRFAHLPYFPLKRSRGGE